MGNDEAFGFKEQGSSIIGLLVYILSDQHCSVENMSFTKKVYAQFMSPGYGYHNI